MEGGSAALNSPGWKKPGVVNDGAESSAAGCSGGCPACQGWVRWDPLEAAVIRLAPAAWYVLPSSFSSDDDLTVSFGRNYACTCAYSIRYILIPRSLKIRSSKLSRMSTKYSLGGVTGALGVIGACKLKCPSCSCVLSMVKRTSAS